MNIFYKKALNSLFLILLIVLVTGCTKNNENTDKISLVVTDVVKIKTLEVETLAYDLATSGGEILDDGGKKILEQGVCWSTNPRPLITNFKTSDDDNGTGTFKSFLTGLYDGVTYYVRAYAITNEGTSYGEELSFSTPSYRVGDKGPAGGTVFYDKGEYSDGWRYLELAPEELGLAQWGECGGNFDTEEDFGTGESNTSKILNLCVTEGIAAQLCDEYGVNGKNDWFLPSIYELYEAYNVVKDDANSTLFSETYYWSSTEYTTSLAHVMVVGQDGKPYSRSNVLNVIAIRKF